MSARKQQILETAIGMIAAEGYARLTMRALARASGMKLGALQYHFPTWEALLCALADYIRTQYLTAFAATAPTPPDLHEVVAFFLDDAPGEPLQGSRLWPQLWAMSQVEPVMEGLLGEIYSHYLRTLEKSLAASGSQHPRADALSLMSLIEGATLFVGRGARWEGDAKAMRDRVLDLIDSGTRQASPLRRFNRR